MSSIDAASSSRRASGSLSSASSLSVSSISANTEAVSARGSDGAWVSTECSAASMLCTACPSS